MIDGHGGVLIALKNNIVSTQIHVSENVELIATNIILNANTNLIIASVYRPPARTDGMYVDERIRDITKINDDHPNDTFWIAGDLNLPDIDWKTMTYYSNHNSLNSKIIDLSYDLGIEQTIHFPTRKTKTLDIFFTNSPSTLLSAKPLPGLGEHDIILAEIKIKPDRLRPTKREILLWKKVDIVKIKIEAMKVVNRLMAKEINNIEESRSTFKGALYIIKILCRRYTFWSYPAGLTIANPPG